MAPVVSVPSTAPFRTASRPAPIPAQNVRPALRQLLEAVGDVPALVLNRRTDVLAGNPLAFLLLADFPAMPAAERNLTRWIVLDPIASELFPGGETVAAEAVVARRLDVGRHPVVGHLDLNFEDLVLSDDPDQVLRVYSSAKPGSPSADSLALLGSVGAGASAPTKPPSMHPER